jgi:hypothetical protein
VIGEDVLLNKAQVDQILPATTFPNYVCKIMDALYDSREEADAELAKYSFTGTSPRKKKGELKLPRKKQLPIKVVTAITSNLEKACVPQKSKSKRVKYNSRCSQDPVFRDRNSSEKSYYKKAQ